jgi:UDP-N-acetylglucosamine acyltransferase
VIHSTALIHEAARVHPDAEIGPYCVVGADVTVGARTRLMGYNFVEGPCVIGDDNLFYPFSSVGVASQDKKYHGERSETRIGDRNNIREFVTIHRGTEGGGLVTSIGDDNLLMAYAHIAHDVQIGSHTTIGNGVTFAGHVTVEDYATISAHCGVHQFCRIGRHCYIGGYSVILQDVLPYSLTVAEREVKVFAENKVGLERRGFAPEQVQAIHKALRLLTRAKLNTSQAVERIRAEVPATAEVEELLAFIAASERGFVK